ncbi:putative late blight resistance protein homolog R1B-14 [Salvia hispanica]|uniref:putative late blight resistance protein homolog R1B-14 n=1 Tax=Salvia hispanica TaxID=49212 RepID=UPI0020099AB4|nr:putative late blight resistance protein homolog R1B-14 [Salvia hispanica]
MAYAVLLSLTQTLDRILSYNEHPISVHRRQQIEQLLRQVKLLHRFIPKLPREANNFETRIRDAANEAEDVIEHFMHEHTASRKKSTGIFLYDFCELDTVADEISSIAKEAAAINTESLQPSSRRPASTPIPAVDSFTVGLEEGFEKIRGLLCDESPEHQIIPITGMGGLGKTTLARMVYHDPLVVETFPVRAWITVSQDYDTIDILGNLLHYLEKEGERGLAKDSDSTVEKIYKILRVKKHLIVFDDVWSGDIWNDMRHVLYHNDNGSRIVITTRITSVASYISSASPLHEMQFLKPDQSWKLLKEKVFPQKDCPSELQKVGQDIATKCKGLPLAIILVAGVLSNVRETRESWEKILDDVNSAINKNGEFDEIMSLSYTHLPLYLRPCFLYMGSFPEDHEIRISKLIKLWIAEGMVESEKEAQEYVNDLIMRSLVLVTSVKSNGKVKSCNIHGMVRDLCKRKALDDNYERRLSNSRIDLRELARAYASTMRSVVSFRPSGSSLRGLRKFKLLRVLDVVDTDAYALPASVFELFHLRYLAFGCPMEVPSAISRLQNLRILIIRPSKRSRKYRYSTDEVYLPLEIWMMRRLMHLISFYDLLPNPEGEASALENLLTLSVVKKLICTEEMMKLICNVRKLAITYFGDKYQQDYKLHNLVLLPQLEKLTLVVKKGSLLQVKAKPVFPETLRKLTLGGWRFPWEDMKAIATLPNLQVLKLRDHAFEGHTWDTNEEADEEQFPKLEYLLIEESDLESWVTEKAHFRILKRLVLHGCGKLSEIPDAIGDISPLELIEVDHANKSLVECVQRIHKEQKEEYDNKLLQVRVL